MLSIIVAIASDGVIGNNNELLWHITEDMKYFRRVTSGHAVVMGRKTYDSIGRPLPKRHNIVISRQNISIEGCSVVGSLEEALGLLDPAEESFIIGGAQIYALALPLSDRMYITHVGGDFEGDTHFPAWNPDEWQLDSEEKFEKGEAFEHPFSFATYKRK
ncbi:MAG: dihydrofolate reductase [Rikenellaceae bacterium]